jgi:hypothetical protein
MPASAATEAAAVAAETVAFSTDVKDMREISCSDSASGTSELLDAPSDGGPTAERGDAAAAAAAARRSAREP